MHDQRIADALKGSTAAPPYTPPPALVALVQSLMEGVSTGRITSLGCLIIGPMGQMQWPGFGMQTLELMTAAELMRDDIKQAMRGGSGSKILRAG